MKLTEKTNLISIKRLVLVAIMTALVIVLQLVGSFIRFGAFSISLVLVPIVIGAAVCGAGAGAWLGLAFGVAVLLSGDAAAFLAVNPFGTIVTVLVKGAGAGFLAGLAYKQLSALLNSLSGRRESSGKPLASLSQALFRYIPVMAAAMVCPFVNTGIFLIGCRLFFYDTISEWGTALGFANAAEYMFIGLAGLNFIFELITNLVLAPVIVRLLSINKKIFKF